MKWVFLTVINAWVIWYLERYEGVTKTNQTKVIRDLKTRRRQRQRKRHLKK